MQAAVQFTHSFCGIAIHLRFPARRTDQVASSERTVLTIFTPSTWRSSEVIGPREIFFPIP